MKKYELTDETVTLWNNIVVHRIKALVDIDYDVKTGDLGGYIEIEKNLSHEGTAWVSGNAKVFGNAKIYDNAHVYDSAYVYDSAKVFGNAKVWDEACIMDDAKIYDYASIRNNVKVFHNARIYGNARIYDDVHVFGNANVFGNNIFISGKARISGSAWISNNSDYFHTVSIGSRNGCVSFYRTKTGIGVTCGCFIGTLKEFATRVDETHGYNEHGQIYRLLIEVAKLRFKGLHKEGQS